MGRSVEESAGGCFRSRFWARSWAAWAARRCRGESEACGGDKASLFGVLLPREMWTTELVVLDWDRRERANFSSYTRERASLRNVDRDEPCEGGFHEV
jgi:hypothetical protein